MIVESKFNYKQRVYWLENNKVRTAIIQSIDFGRFFRVDGNNCYSSICYFVSKSVKSSVINWNGGGLKEDQIFASKKDLLKSL